MRDGSPLRRPDAHPPGDGVLDAVGVGIGPSNLSVAALLEPVGDVRARFFERKPEFQWHPGLLFPDATIQVSFLKDLVTLADPSSPYSFLSFLAARGRLYRFITAGFGQVRRWEFDQYYRWVSAALPTLAFGRPVEAVSFEDGQLVVEEAGGRHRSRAVILGTGLTPAVPPFAEPHLGESVFHASDYLHREAAPAGGRVVVVGGGQTGAEVFLHLLSSDDERPASVTWVTRRPNFLPLDDSPFINELFTPGYSDYFFRLGATTRAHLLAEQKLASDGVSMATLDEIYRRLYALEYRDGAGAAYRLCPGHELTDLRPRGEAWSLAVRDRIGGAVEELAADAVVLCTGYAYRRPPCLEPLAGRLSWADGGFELREDYSVAWDGPPHLRVYVQNAARQQRGVADPNLSLVAWRSACIVNSLAGRRVYDTTNASTVFDWPTHAHVAPLARNGTRGRP